VRLGLDTADPAGTIEQRGDSTTSLEVGSSVELVIEDLAGSRELQISDSGV
jgi:hypothetical protein